MLNRIYTFLILMVFIFIGNIAFAQTSQIQLLEKGSKNPIQYANLCWQSVTNSKQNGNTVADFQGKLTIPDVDGKKLILSVTCVGYKSVYDTLQLSQSQVIYMEEDVLNLEQVTVTGTRTPHTLKNAPVLTQMITEKEIENLDSETLPDILQVEMPGVEMASHGGIPVMNMMGLENQYSLILIDGERMAKSLHKSVDFTRINTANIERIEIVRGASSALYGSDAMGGVINIITKAPQKKLSVATDFRYQERNQKNHSQNDLDNTDGQYEKDYYKNLDRENLNANLSVGFKKGNFRSKTFLNYKTKDAYVLKSRDGVLRNYDNLGIKVQQEVDPKLTTISGFKDYSASQNFGYQTGRWDFELKGDYFFHEESDVDLKNNSKEIGSTDGDHQIYESYTLKGKASYQVNKNSKLTFLSHFDSYLRFNYDEKEELYRSYKTHNNEYLTNKITFTTLLGKHSFLAEVENLQQFLESNKFIKTEEVLKKSTGNTVIVLQDEYKLTDQSVLVAGIRAGYHSSFNFHYSPSVNFKYNLGLFNMRLSYARGFRSPDLKELYFSWSHLGAFDIIGNKDLKPEKNDYFAYSLDFVNGARNLNATLIASYNKVFDKIDGIWTNNDKKYTYRNFENAKVYTVEALLKWKFLNHFTVKSGYIYNKTKKSADGADLSTMSPMALTAQFQYQFSKENYRMTANISGKITGKKDIISQDTDEDSPYYQEYFKVKYPTYSIWNLNVNHHFGKNIRLRMGLKNVFDYKAPVVSFNSTYTPGRKYYLTIGYQF